MISWLWKTFHTVRFLRPIQIYSRIKLKFYLPSVDTRNLPNIRKINNHWKSKKQKKTILLSRWKFRFLNEEHSIKKAYDWDNPSLSKLWRYNLHYFDCLNDSFTKSRIDLHKELIAKWVKDNPPFLGTGWEPYPSSLRIINWIKWALSGNELPKKSISSLTIQTRWLFKHLEFHILGNHLFANAKALVFSGLFFEGKEADKWFNKGIEILENEVPEQVLNDGGHFELSTMYHALVLEDLLDLINIINLFKIEIREGLLINWKNKVSKMIFWLQNMSHPDGKVSFFNDAAFGISSNKDELIKYAKYLDIDYVYKSMALTYLEDSGYIKLENASALALLDVARIGPDYLPGHAHADTLCFELSLFGHRIFVNSGVSQYGNNPTRHKQRSTSSHNTVCVDDKNSSDVWSGFRVANRAYPSKPKIIKLKDGIKVSCSHNGYDKLTTKCTHERMWKLESRAFYVKDKIIGKFKNAIAKFYIHPDVKVDFKNSNIGFFRLKLISGKILRINVTGADKLKLETSKWFPEFGKSINNKCITVNFTSSELTFCVSW
jgi:uncharacterized heparinase superfamily protein